MIIDQESDPHHQLELSPLNYRTQQDSEKWEAGLCSCKWPA